MQGKESKSSLEEEKRNLEIIKKQKNIRTLRNERYGQGYGILSGLLPSEMEELRAKSS